MDLAGTEQGLKGFLPQLQEFTSLVGREHLDLALADRAVPAGDP